MGRDSDKICSTSNGLLDHQSGLSEFTEERIAVVMRQFIYDCRQIFFQSAFFVDQHKLFSS